MIWLISLILKPSILELNRERRKPAKGYTGIVITPGNNGTSQELLVNVNKWSSKYSLLLFLCLCFRLIIYASIWAFSVSKNACRSWFVNQCRQLGLGEGGFYQPGYQNGGLLHLKIMCLGKNWDCETRWYGETRPVDGSVPPQIPVEFSQLVEKAIKESQSLVATYSKKMKGGDEIPLMLPDICIVNFYTSTGRLGLHQVSVYHKTSFFKFL